MLKEILRDRLFLILSFILTIIALSYPLTVTFDTGHYMFLADVIKDGIWAKWDPIRGIIFPLFLNVSTNILGRNHNALLIPLILAQLTLFTLSTYLILQAADVKNSLYKKLIIALVFLLIMLDPVILGYYHTLLTEFFAATLAVISIYFSFKLYDLSESLPALSRPLLLFFFYFLLSVPFAWHLKQPYVGIALFPFLLSCFLIGIRKFREKKVILYVAIANMLVIVSLVSSIFLWASFLRFAGMPEKPDRELSGFINQAYEAKAETAFATPVSFVKYIGKNYFTLSNLFYFEKEEETVVIVKRLSLLRAFQNKIIANRMYDLYGESNTFFMTEELKSHIQFLSSDYRPPLWLNKIQVARERISNFLFTTSYLLIPAIFVYSTVVAVKRKTQVVLFVFMLCGSSLLNIVMHSIFISPPVDRYVFWGYPLNLIVFIIIIIKLLQRTGISHAGG